jgi:hypothetical protein
MTVEIFPLSLKRSAELAAIRNTSWSLVEHRALASSFADEVKLFEIGLTNEDISLVSSAYLQLERIALQMRGLNLGLGSAITKILYEREKKI